MKSISHWLTQITDPELYNAIYRYKKDWWETSEANSLYEAIRSAFVWYATIEGEAYWSKISESFR